MKPLLDGYEADDEASIDSSNSGYSSQSLPLLEDNHDDDQQPDLINEQVSPLLPLISCFQLHFLNHSSFQISYNEFIIFAFRWLQMIHPLREVVEILQSPRQRGLIHLLISAMVIRAHQLVVLLEWLMMHPSCLIRMVVDSVSMWRLKLKCVPV